MKKSALLFILAILISGCAFGTRRPMLTYSTILPAASKNNITIKVAPFKDERAWSKEKIGDVRNGYGMRCADIIPQNSEEEWLTEAFKKELENAGYSITDTVKPDVTLEGTALDIYVNAYWNYGGRLKLNIILKRSDRVILSKEYSAEKNCGTAWASTAESFGKTLEMTLQDLMKKIIPDINKVLLENANNAK
jgi:uncharacterized lipoprotein YajG